MTTLPESQYLSRPLRTLEEARAAQQKILHYQLCRQLSRYEAEADPIIRGAVYNTITHINKRLAALR